MCRIKLTLPIVPSINHCYTNTHHGRRVLKAAGKRWKETAQHIAMAEKTRQKWPYSVNEKLVGEVWVYWPTTRKRDVDNIGKLLWDSLQGVLYDEDMYILPRYMDFDVDRKNPRVEVLLYRHKEGQK